MDEKGFVLVDDITPDYKIVNKDGKQIDIDGKPVEEKIDTIKLDEFDSTNIFGAYILEQIKASQDETIEVQHGYNSSGTHLVLSADKDDEGPSPADSLVIDVNPDGTAKTILGKNVVLRDKNKTNKYNFNSEIDKHMDKYITGGDKYSKSVNGTIFNKTKWKAVMALKGTGATIIFENPKNNFNKLKGRIATHYFTYSDRTTECTLFIYSEDDGEELFSTSGFNYNGGISFECTFPRKTSSIRFELEVNGQYTSRVCYLRNCEFGFDRSAYEDELYEDESNMEFVRKYGTDSNADYYEDEVELDDGMGEKSVEGEDPGARYRRINNISDDDYWLNMNYDEDDDSITESMKASISEARKRREEEDEKRDSVSGPAFDPDLINATEAVGPDGSSRFIAGKDVSD